MRGGEKYEREGIRKKASKKEKWCRRFYLGPHKPMVTSAGTLQSNNRRLIGCLISFTRSAEFNRSRLLDLLEKPKSKSF